MDEHLRQLQRKASEADVVAQSAWLRGQLKSGFLSREAIRLAALAGDESARLVIGESDFPVIPQLGGFETWEEGNDQGLDWLEMVAEEFNNRVVVLCAWSAANSVVGVWQPFADEGTASELASCLECARQWVNCPCATCGAAAERSAQTRPSEAIASQTRDAIGNASALAMVAYNAARAARSAALAASVASGGTRSPVRHASQAILDSLMAAADVSQCQDASEHRITPAAVLSVWQTVLAEVVAYSIGGP